MTPENEIRQRARALGFSHVGIATAGPLEPERSRLHTWLERGMHASMAWMRRTEVRRGDPCLVLPGARSVIAVALNYYTPHVHAAADGTGKISRYAWGEDYHAVLEEKLARLLAWIQERFPGTEGRTSVDSGPVMDKVWAHRGGIGWIGKHSSVITRDLGSWVFLGEIITTLVLDPDAPATDQCGTCTACIKACPTGAIVEPYVVDSNRCLSYLTIEHRGAVEPDLHSRFDGWVFGCDVCQDVCPWNQKFARESDEPRFQPRAECVTPDLREWRTMSEEEFTARFRGSPIRRAKHAGLMRTLDILLGKERSDPKGRVEASNSARESIFRFRV